MRRIEPEPGKPLYLNGRIDGYAMKFEKVREWFKKQPKVYSTTNAAVFKMLIDDKLEEIKK
jgi:hypothetical protein